MLRILPHPQKIPPNAIKGRLCKCTKYFYELICSYDWLPMVPYGNSIIKNESRKLVTIKKDIFTAFLDSKKHMFFTLCEKQQTTYVH